MPRLWLLTPLFIALGSACESSTPAPEQPIDQSSGGFAGEGAPGSGGAPADTSDVALVPVDGWVSGDDNALGVQGAVSVVADAVTAETLETSLEGPRLCLRGTASQVDLSCTPASPTTDCFDLFFGAILALNLNQADADEAAMPYDASRFTGFGFDVVGPLVPRNVRFSVEASDGASYCLPFNLSPHEAAHWDVAIDELITRCHQARPGAASAGNAKPRLTALRWTVFGDYTASTPFDFCVENLRVKVD